jgi:hypothetical protein
VFEEAAAASTTELTWRYLPVRWTAKLTLTLRLP